MAGREKQFGYDCDYIGLSPQPAGSAANDRFLIVVNHEYTATNLMFAGIGEGRASRTKASKAQAEVEMAAQGGSVVEIVRESAGSKVVRDSKFARRITATTPIEISGHTRRATAGV